MARLGSPVDQNRLPLYPRKAIFLWPSLTSEFDPGCGKNTSRFVRTAGLWVWMILPRVRPILSIGLAHGAWSMEAVFTAYRYRLTRDYNTCSSLLCFHLSNSGHVALPIRRLGRISARPPHTEKQHRIGCAPRFPTNSQHD